MIFHFCCFIHLYPDLTRCCAGLFVQLQVPDWMKVWINIDAIPYPKAQYSVPQRSTKGPPFSLFHSSNEPTFSPLLLISQKNQLFYPVTLFIALILFRSIILKVISTQIYPLKAHSLDLALKRFHKLSRSSFREIVLFCM